MRNLVATLDINYPKEITDITFPLMETYAKNNNADFKIITERKWPNLPVTLEKFQLYDLCEGYEWVMFLDADCALGQTNCALDKLVNKTEIFVPMSMSLEYHWHSDLIPSELQLSRHYNFMFLVFNKVNRNCIMPHQTPLQFLKYINKDSQAITQYIKFNGGKFYDSSWFLDEFIFSLNVAKYNIPVKVENLTNPKLFLAHTAGSVATKVGLLQEYVNSEYNNFEYA